MADEDFPVGAGLGIPGHIDVRPSVPGHIEIDLSSPEPPQGFGIDAGKLKVTETVETETEKERLENEYVDGLDPADF